jgi:hypothetical protein
MGVDFMRHLVLCVVTAVVLISYLSIKPGGTAFGDQHLKKISPLDGAYEFVSETLELTNPESITERISTPAWTGLWLFQDGRFSQTMMKKGRGFLTYPKRHASIGYESSAGTYVADTSVIKLEKDLSLHPLGAGRSVTLEYRFEGDLLILIEKMHPYTENIANGKRITTLKRVE